MSTLTSARIERVSSIPTLAPAVGTALAVVFAWTYWPVITGLVAQWGNEPEYSHGFLIPVISAYLLWSTRDAIRAAVVEPSPWGIGVMTFAMMLYVTGSIGADLFLQRLSMLVMLTGGVLFVAGLPMLRVVLFPLGLLLLMIPLPGIIFNAIAFPLQLFAAKTASGVLEACAVPVFREGNIMHLASVSLDVEEACSGIRSLMSLTALSVVYTHLVYSNWKPRTLLLAAVVPIAIIANVFRVTVTGLLAHYVSVETAMDVFHTASGVSVFLIAAAMLLGVSHLIRRAGVPE